MRKLPLIGILSLLALGCGDSAPKKETPKPAPKATQTKEMQDKMELVALFEAFNSHNYTSQQQFVDTWNKLDTKHQLEALDNVITGHRFEVDINIEPIIKDHEAKIKAAGNEDADNENMKKMAAMASKDIAQHAFFLRQALVLWNEAKRSKEKEVLDKTAFLETDLRNSIEHFAQLVRFVDVYSMLPSNDSLPCENIKQYHCELVGEKYDELRIHVKDGSDPTDIKFDQRTLDFLRFTALHFNVDGKDNVDLKLTPNPIINFKDPVYVEELFDFLAQYGHYNMDYDEKTKKLKLIPSKPSK